MYKWVRHLGFNRIYFNMMQDWNTGADLDFEFMKDTEYKQAIEYLQSQENVYFQGLS